MTSSKALSYFLTFFILGIALTSIAKISQTIVWVFLFLGFLSIISSIFFNKKIYTVIGFCFLFFTIGLLRFQISEFNISNDELSKFNGNPEKITLKGEIIAEPDLRDSFQKLKVKVGNSIVLVTMQRYPEYEYLDKIKITGKLKEPKVFDDFNYKNYLMKDGIYSVMDFPVIELLSKEHEYNVLTFLYEKLLFLKSNLSNSIDVNFSPPKSFIMQGIVFGNDKNMSKELKDKFNSTGLSHLTAVSGSNIVMIISILMYLMLFLGFWRGQAFYFAVIMIWIYLLLIGLPISGIRAGIMGSILLLAEKLGRQNTSARILIVACALMLLQNPLLLFYDIGFQLSFLASMGIIYLKPIIDIGLKKITKEKFKLISDIISVTFAAQIFTLPIIIYNFGRLSLIAPLTNVLILPIIPLLTILGFLVSILGLFSSVLGFIFSLPCLLMLSYFLKIIDIFYQSWAVKIIENVSWIWIAVYYFLLIMIVWFLNKRHKKKYLGG